MHVLQYAQSVRRHVHPEVLLVLGVPSRGEVFDLQRAVHEGLLQFVPHHDVQRIGQFVRLGADEGALDSVDVAAPIRQGHLPQLLAEGALQFGIVLGPKLGATADDVLHQARLALVHGHRGAAARHRVVQRGIALTLVHPVPHLVDGREDGRRGILLVVVVGDAHVQPTEAVGEGVLALLDDRLGGVETHDLAKTFFAVGLLLVHGVLAGGLPHVGVAFAPDLVDQGHQALLQKVEKAVVFGHAVPRLVVV